MKWWAEYHVNVTNYVDGETDYDIEDVWEVIINTANMDGSLIGNDQANNMIGVVYSRRRDLLVANQKALEVIHMRSDPTVGPRRHLSGASDSAVDAG